MTTPYTVMRKHLPPPSSRPPPSTVLSFPPFTRSRSTATRRDEVIEMLPVGVSINPRQERPETG